MKRDLLFALAINLLALVFIYALAEGFILQTLVGAARMI
jgi:hypothetical protein